MCVCARRCKRVRQEDARTGVPAFLLVRLDVVCACRVVVAMSARFLVDVFVVVLVREHILYIRTHAHIQQSARGHSRIFVGEEEVEFKCFAEMHT